MSLYGVMRTGGSGMNAQSNKLSTVADNIANGNTTVTIDGRTRHVISYLQDFLFAPDRARIPGSVENLGRIGQKFWSLARRAPLH